MAIHMERVLKKRQLILLFMLTYFVSYLTRNNFAAVVVEVADALEKSRSALSICFTCSFITYGLGQILSGWLGDRISPKRLVLYGLLTTTSANLLITFFREPWIMAVLWGVNGLAQAFLWPPLAKLMVSFLSEDEYKKAVIYINYAGTAGTITVYAIAPLLLSAFGWKGIFFVAGGGGLIMALLWMLLCPDIRCVPLATNEEQAEEALPPSTGLSQYLPILFLVMLATVMHGTLRDGVITWVPSYISEVFHMENQISILASVVLPIFGLISFGVSGWLYRKHLKNPLICALLFFGIGLFMTVGLLLLMGRVVLLDVILLSLLVASMQGVNLMLTGMMPALFKHTGRISLVSGVINSCTYVGSAISAYGIAVLSETKGWTVTVGCWAGIASLGLILCILSLPLWKKKGL